MERWQEYKDGKLTPPAIIQHDVVGKENLIWVWTGDAIIGPLSRLDYDEAAILQDVATIIAEMEIVPVDSREVEIETLKTQISTLTAENTMLKAKNETLEKTTETVK